MTTGKKPGIPPKDCLSEKKASLYALFDTYCEASKNSYIHLPDALQEMQLDKLIRKDKKIAYDFLSSDISWKKKLTWINKLYSDCRLTDYEPLLKLLYENSKLLRRSIEKVIRDKEKKTRERIEQMYPELDEEAQDWAKQLFRYWDNTHAKAKIKFKNKKEVIAYCSKHIELFRTMQIAWLPLKPYTRIPWADGSDFVPRPVVRYILSEYMAFPQAIRLKDCDSIVPFFDQPEWYTSLELLVTHWLSDGTEANKKGILAPYCFYGADWQVEHLHERLKEWQRKGRKGIIGYTIDLLGLKESLLSLNILNEWIELMPDSKYRRKALNAFRQAATRQKLSTDELADRIVPSFGFNRSGEKEVDYGTRGFRVTLLPDFSFSVFDPDKQKMSKSLPAPIKKDDREKAEQARNELSGIKKQLKIQTAMQKSRLERALKNQRTWTGEAWLSLFVENPVMRYMTNGLIWGTYKDGQLQTAFCHRKDGAFMTADKMEFILPEEAVVALVHPAELDNEQIARWNEQLSKLPTEPLLTQLSAPVHRLSEEEKQGKEITRYSGRTVRLSNIYDFESKDLIVRIDDQTLYIIDRSLPLAARLSFVYEASTCLLSELSFLSYKEREEDDPDTIELADDEKIPLSSLTKRFISSLLDVLIKAFAL